MEKVWRLDFFSRGDLSWEGSGTLPLRNCNKPPRIYEKLPCKEEPNWFSGQRDPLEQTYSQTSWYCNIRIIYPTEQQHDTTDI